MDCGMQICKILMFIFNFLAAIVGLVLVGIGAFAKAKEKDMFPDHFDVDPANVGPAAVFIIVLGLVVFTIAFFGCCGAIKENHCMLLTFSIILGIIFVLMLIAGAVAFAIGAPVVRTAAEKLTTMAIEKYQYKPKPGSEAEKLVGWMDMIQESVKCCGVNNMDDWANTTLAANWNNNSSAPDSCCQKKNQGCGADALLTPESKKNLFPDGCVAQLNSVIMFVVYILGGFSIGLAFIILVGIIMGCCLARAVN